MFLLAKRHQQQGARRRLDFALEHVFITIIIISAQPQISAHFQGQKFKKRPGPQLSEGPLRLTWD